MARRDFRRYGARTGGWVVGEDCLEDQLEERLVVLAEPGDVVGPVRPT